MSRKSRARLAAISQARGATHGLFIFLSFASVMATAAGDAGAIPEGQKLSRVEEPFVVALAAPTVPSLTPPAALSTPIMSAPLTPPPARFFTINEVLAKRNNAEPSSIKLASIDPGQMDFYAGSGATRSDEPFGLSTFVAPDGLLWSKWRKVEADIRAAQPILARCLADPKQCSPAATRFSAIVNEARERAGRAKIELVNERVNAAIRYTNDMAQWGVADLWSAPLDTNNTGSFNTGFGDCEDFAIAKYVALREAGFPAGDLRVLLVRDNVVRMDHAVLAARADGRWLILDNRYSALTEENDARSLTPLFAINADGVKLFAAPYASTRPVNGGNMTGSANAQLITVGGGSPSLAGSSSADVAIGKGGLLLLM